MIRGTTSIFCHDIAALMAVHVAANFGSCASSCFTRVSDLRDFYSPRTTSLLREKLIIYNVRIRINK